ncbi:divergent protein kinase domain 1A-like isoform X2 [Ptychodera flava]|uniref:divergent protein kinase domain 1A-like isoform X2 n=1 Tax=Ptychodera flava TaxID=63121 RepID=UPI00396AAF81
MILQLSPSLRLAQHMQFIHPRTQLKVKHILVIWSFIFVCSWMGYLKYSNYVDLCREHAMTTVICDRYRKGVITGSLCEELCETKIIIFSKCLSHLPSQQVYSGYIKATEPKKNPKHIIIKHNMEKFLSQDPMVREAVYNKPEKGSSMDDFRVMLKAYLERRLGDGDYTDLMTRIIDVADINYDGKVTLAEAKTMWALLQNSEFFMMMVLKDSDHIPKLEGFCGDMFIVEEAMVDRVYGVELPGVINMAVPNSYKQSIDQWFTPTWPQKAHIAVGMLEFIEEIFHGSNGNLYMCDLTEHSIGFTEKHEVKVINFANLVPETTLEQVLRERHCTQNTDCSYAENCITICDHNTHQCTGQVVHPNLQKVCVLLHMFLLRGAPKDVKLELEEELEKCLALDASKNSDIQLEHSLVLNSLKSTLWKQISNEKFGYIPNKKSR